MQHYLGCVGVCERVGERLRHAVHSDGFTAVAREKIRHDEGCIERIGGLQKGIRRSQRDAWGRCQLQRVALHQTCEVVRARCWPRFRARFGVLGVAVAAGVGAFVRVLLAARPK